MGGKVDKAGRYVEPTIIDNPDPKSAVLQEEVFGPIIAIVSIKSIDEAIRIVNSKDKPLVVYYFGKVLFNKNIDRMLNETSSGAFVVNEAFLQNASHGGGFGGVGASGQGRYVGYEGFKSWSNAKSVMVKPAINMFPFNAIHPPFTESRQKIIRQVISTPGEQNVVLRMVLIIIFTLIVLFYLN